MSWTGDDVHSFLRRLGLDVSGLDDVSDLDEVRRLASAVVLLGGPAALTPAEVWDHAGAPPELGRRLWRAMGFADLPDDAPALAESDAKALRAINEYIELSGVSPDVVVRFTRMLGQSMSRVADALLGIADQSLEQLPGAEDVGPDELRIFGAVIVNPLIEAQLSYLLRRHLYAGALRRFDTPDASDDAATTIGFADVVSFTRLSGQLPEADLAELLERFEETCTDEVAEHGGRVVKLIGDAVLFQFDDVVDAAECAIDMVDHFGGDHPDLRVGLAHGRVVARLGDLFGPTVNLASRLVGFARPGTVLVDESFQRELAGAGSEFRTKSLRPRDLKGIGTTPMHVLRR